ncbi:chorismate-binding protein [Photobacterium jeanii]|uniref:Chorismate-binding protein n=1 Tax=Photobacterium jeanii TaxID=858640 RepID=A0A178K3B2_9GAMM|nr:chromate efflux transporter [Photobacterium jeanii]OAN11596.1 chorismate-binding protein [Photobacterium jeanii]PST91117.1 chorismate-binding protein [Photobacterium jeanii]
MITVFVRFFVLGLFSFGGPAAHIGFFQREFVEKRKWLTSDDFTQAVALCQFLPGPASSQLGMYIGYKQAGYLGALGAFVGFTLPSFALLTFIAVMSAQSINQEMMAIFIQAAKLLAVIVVADALWGMAKKNVNTPPMIAIAAVTAVWVFFSTGLLGQIVPILFAAVVGFAVTHLGKSSTSLASSSSPLKISPHKGLLATFAVLLIGLPLVAELNAGASLFNIFYQAGSFVFGGGHVVLPLLQPMLEGMVASDDFLAAYASAQLVPGPMFTMASYLGTVVMPSSPILGSAIATIAVFLPGALLLFAFLPAWQAIFSHAKLKASISYVNASVVGLLASAFVSPVISSAVTSITDVVVVIVGYLLLKYKNTPVWVLAILLGGYSMIAH